MSENNCWYLLVSFRNVSDGLTMLTLEAIQLASYWCVEVDCGRRRVVSKEWHHTFEWLSWDRSEQAYAEYFAPFSLPPSHGIA